MSNPRWLDVVKHRIRGVRAPFLIVLQHHDIPAATRLVAPVLRPVPGDVDALTPLLDIDGSEYRVRLLDIGSAPTRQLGETVMSAMSNQGEILDALDMLLHGYPVGRPN